MKYLLKFNPLFIIVFFLIIVMSCGNDNDNPPIVTGIIINPVNTIIERGSSHTFTANVIGTGNIPQTVVWNVLGSINLSTFISQTGVLTIAPNELSPTITIMATSTIDANFSGLASINVIDFVLNPTNATVNKGNTLTFSAEIIGLDNDFPQIFNWSIIETVAEGTSINDSGILTIATNETLSTLTVRVSISVANNNLYREAIVTIAELNDNETVFQIGVDEVLITLPFGTSHYLRATHISYGNNITILWGHYDQYSMEIVNISRERIGVLGNPIRVTGIKEGEANIIAAFIAEDLVTVIKVTVE